MLNNFDKSSTGVNVELSAYYDNDLARIYFDECFVRDGDNLIYTDWGNLRKSWKKTLTLEYSINTEDFIKECLNQDFYQWGYPVECVKTKLGILLDGVNVKTWRDISRDEIVEWAIDFFDDDFIEMCMENYFTKNYTTEVVIGYSQGDRVTVIIPEDLREILGVPDDREIVPNETLTNLIYSSPVYGRIIINGDYEIYIDEMLKDWYEWDKDDVMEELPRHLSAYTDEQKKIIIDFCDENLPENLDYID